MQRVLSQEIASATHTFEAPHKRYDQSRRRIFVDDFDRDAIRRKIHHLYEEKKHLTLDVIHQVLEECDLFNGGRSSLAKELHGMGFTYKRINNKR